MYISSETLWNFARVLVGVLAVAGIVGGAVA